MREIDPDLDEYVNDPEVVAMSQREKAAQEERERREEAAKLRMELRKAGEVPSGIQEVIADLLRVAEDSDLNPWGYAQRSLTEERYKFHGRWYLEDIFKFGSFAYLKAEAGLNAKKDGSRLLLRSRTAAAKAQKNAEYFDKHIRPYVDRFPELSRETDKATLIAFISDTHGFFADPLAVLSFFEFVKDAQPEIIALGGDHIDATEISTHPSVPGATFPLQDELDHQREFARELHTLAPNAKMFLVESNHGVEVRLMKFLTQHARELTSLRSLQLDTLLGFDELPIEVIVRPSFLTKRTRSNTAMKRVHNVVGFTHGTSTAKNAAAVELASWGISGISGHVHKASKVYGASAANRHMCWATSPGGVCDDVALHYIPGAGPAWQTGWTVAEIYRGRVSIEHAICAEHSVSVNGWRYEAKKKFPTKYNDIAKFWRRRWKIQENR